MNTPTDQRTTESLDCRQLAQAEPEDFIGLAALYGADNSEQAALIDTLHQRLKGGQLLFVCRQPDRTIIAAAWAVQSFYCWYLQHLTTATDHRRRGIAGKLLAEVCREASARQLALKIPGPDVPDFLAGTLGSLGFELTMDPCQGALWVREA